MSESTGGADRFTCGRMVRATGAQTIGNIKVPLSPICLGTWIFGEGNAVERRKKTLEVMNFAISNGINMIDTAPLYGQGFSEEVLGEFLKNKKREDIIVATKLGLSKEDSGWVSNLKKERMYQELDESRKRLSTDYIDLYQVHYPDPSVPIASIAETMYGFYQKGMIKAIGVSNFNLSQIKKFMKYSPLHALQNQFHMFNRGMEDRIGPFCFKNSIAVISYAPLNVGLLTGKFFLKDIPLSLETAQRINAVELTEPRFSINKTCLFRLNNISKKYEKSLAQLVINWTFSQKGIASCIVGMRDIDQAEENLKSMGWSISEEDMEEIGRILEERERKIKLSPVRRMVKKITSLMKGI